MSITYVGGQVNNPAGTGTSITTGAFTAIGAGHSIVLSGQYGSNVTLNSVTDNASGNTYVVKNSNVEWSTFGVYFFIVTGVNITGGPTTFTFNFSGSTNNLGICLDEFANVSAINTFEAYTNITSANPASALTTTVANCALLSMIADGVGLTAIPSGYTAGASNAGNNGMSGAYNLTSGAAGTYTATWTDGAGANAVAGVALAPITAFTASITETGSAADAPSATLHATGTINESGSAADAPTALLHATASVAETGSAADALTALLAALASVSEVGSAADALTGALAAAGTITETGSASDTSSSRAQSSVAESGSAADLLTELMAAVASLVETGNAQDLVTFANSAKLHNFIARSYWGWRGTS